MKMRRADGRRWPAWLAAALLLAALGMVAAAEGVHKRRLKFAPGRTSTTVSHAVIRGEADEYVVGAGAGQRMTVEVSAEEGNAAFHIYQPGSRETLAGAGEGDDATRWSGELPQTGDYVIVVAPTRGNATYRLKVQIR